MTRWRCAALLLGGALACDAAPVQVVTPPGLPAEVVALPDEPTLRAQLDDALARKRREDLELALDAVEPGEQLSHATLSQVALDRGVFTLADLFRAGDDLFAYGFRPEQGLGNGLAGRPGIAAGSRPAPNLRRVHAGSFGGPDAMACLDCHAVGGDDGAGALTQNAFLTSDGDRTRAADVRNPPSVLGDGPIERLAEEMSASLADQRAEAVAHATTAGAPFTIDLIAKGVRFGALTARADGTVDTHAVAGVAPDLVVRPFGWKGHARLRDAVKEAFRIHLGLLALADQQAVRDGRLPAALYGDGPWFDADRDGVTLEVEDGMISTMVAYLAQLEVPVIEVPDDADLRDRFARGRAVFDRVGCASCHVPALVLDAPALVTRAEEVEHAASPPIVVDVSRDGLGPKIDPLGQTGPWAVRLFSDLRRHDLGAGLAAPGPQDAPGGSIAATVWLTRPLWGLADSAPYLHDGRAPTIADAIVAHGGEAQVSRDAYRALADDDRAALLVFLSSLARERKVVVP